MRVTNRHELPESYWRACAQQRGFDPKRISITELLSPPQQRYLKRQHDHEIEIDCADQVDAFFGTAVHEHLARFAPRTASAEETLEWTDREGSGITVHGTPDYTEDGHLIDWKTTRVRALEYDRIEWEQQVNLYAWLCDQQEHTPRIKSVTVWALLRDYDKQKRWEDGYPSAPLVKIPMPLWGEERQWNFLTHRLHLHDSAQSGFYGTCTDEERWKRESWAVYGVGKLEGRAKHVARTKDEAREYAKATTPDLGMWQDWYEVVKRDGEPLRCKEYCTVADFCKQWQSERPDTLAETLEASVRAITAQA